MREVFEAALELAPDARAPFLEKACNGNALLIGEVQRMLAADAEPNSLLDAGGTGSPRLSAGAIFATHFHIGDAIGRGGMGEVYRGRDTNLNREVALKVISDSFIADPDRLARFKREAQLLASLNHPNIAAIYGFEESNGVQALVLELVEGPTLADRLARGPIPVDEALLIARQIAEALEAAHELGIIHRDLKPANVKLRADGVVKVLDFGLAKALQPAHASGEDAAASPTITSPAMTRMGILLGTPAYMAPEQAKGNTVDRRGDIWAFGAVLYEMLSGRRLFAGESISETLASVIRQEIEWTAIPSSTPTPARVLMARCLDRDVRRRLRDIGEARIVLEALITPGTGNAGTSLVEGGPSPVAPQRALSRRAMPLALVAAGAGAIGASAAWFLRPQPPGEVARLSFSLPDGQLLFPNRGAMAISPDGSQVVYATVSGLYLRPIAGLESKVIRGTEGYFNMTEPVFSPDGRSIAFHTGSDQTLKRILMTGGAAVTICHAQYPYSLSWGPAGLIFVEFNRPELHSDARIMRVPEHGGTPQQLASFKSGEAPYGPLMLPGGRYLMFTIATGSAPDRWDHARIVVQSLTSGERRTIVEGGSDARLAPTGHLVYALGGSLFAAPFDAQRPALTGHPVQVLEGLSRAAADATGAAHFSFSQNGTLIYVPSALSRVQWLQRAQGTDIAITDRTGKVDPLNLPPGPYESPRVSPDGARIVFGTDDGKEAIVWIYDLSGKGAMRRLTFGGHNRNPTWSSDGKRVAFQSDRDGDEAIFWQAIDSGKAERMTKPEPGESHEPQAFSPKGDSLLFDVTTGEGVSLWICWLRDRKVARFGDVHSTVRTGAVFSPDGRWVAYGTSEGRTIYVEPFPPNGVKHEYPAKDNRPNQPGWSPDGTELFCNPGPSQFASIGVTTKPVFTFGKYTALPRRFLGSPPLVRRSYDITPEGKFVSTVQPGQTASIQTEGTRIQVVLNWFEDLRARLSDSR
jgi:serine/threonine-protein kinase